MTGARGRHLMTEQPRHPCAQLFKGILFSLVGVHKQIIWSSQLWSEKRACVCQPWKELVGTSTS